MWSSNRQIRVADHTDRERISERRGTVTELLPTEYQGSLTNVLSCTRFMMVPSMESEILEPSWDLMVLKDELRVSFYIGQNLLYSNFSGLVHVSNITGARLESASEIVRRNQRVKVKVMSIAGTKYSLSMKDVDQQSGADLS